MKKKSEPLTKEEYQSTVLDLFRKILEGVQLEDVDFGDRLKGQDRINFLSYCSGVVNSPWFDLIFAALYTPQIMAAAKQAENYDIVVFHRATANGISLLKEFFQKYNTVYVTEFQSPAPGHDPHAAFSPVENK